MITYIITQTVVELFNYSLLKGNEGNKNKNAWKEKAKQMSLQKASFKFIGGASFAWSRSIQTISTSAEQRRIFPLSLAQTFRVNAKQNRQLGRKEVLPSFYAFSFRDLCSAQIEMSRSTFREQNNTNYQNTWTCAIRSNLKYFPFTTLN